MWVRLGSSCLCKSLSRWLTVRVCGRAASNTSARRSRQGARGSGVVPGHEMPGGQSSSCQVMASLSLVRRREEGTLVTRAPAVLRVDNPTCSLAAQDKPPYLAKLLSRRHPRPTSNFLSLVAVASNRKGQPEWCRCGLGSAERYSPVVSSGLRTSRSRQDMPWRRGTLALAGGGRCKKLMPERSYDCLCTPFLNMAPQNPGPCRAQAILVSCQPAAALGTKGREVGGDSAGWTAPSLDKDRPARQ